MRHSARRFAAGLVLSLIVLTIPMAFADSTEDSVRSSVLAFLKAFEQGDSEYMQQAFAADAVTFPRTRMEAELKPPIEQRDYRRVAGIDPQMLELIAAKKAAGIGPPYFELTPYDLEINVIGEVALVTFHLIGERLGRRTLVLALRDRQWKIIHLHASNVRSSPLTDENNED